MESSCPFFSLSHLGRGAAMIIESLRLFYHLRCFKCCVCHVQLGNGSAGTDVRVRNNKLHCQNCYSNDEGIIQKGQNEVYSRFCMLFSESSILLYLPNCLLPCWLEARWGSPQK